jgi:type II secretory pathway pseudopilin PulG
MPGRDAMLRHQMTATVQHASSVFRLRRGGVFATAGQGKDEVPNPNPNPNLNPQFHSQAVRSRLACFSLFSHRRAFTAIEMVGVLAIIALLASATLPKMIRKIDRTVWEKEKADQQAMADSLTASILRNKTITNYAGIPGAIAKEMALSLSGITSTPRAWSRAFLVDPNFRIGGATLPYAQSSNGATGVTNARVMILASIAGDVPVPSSDNNSDFQAIWDTPEGSKPTTTTWNTWTGKGEDLLIKKINLEPLFYQLVLVDHDGASQARFFIDDPGTTVNAAGGQGTQAYYLDGTVLGLYDSNMSLQTRYLLQRNISFMFEAGAWRGQIQGSGIQTNGNDAATTVTASNFVTRATTFYNEPTNPNSQSQSASQTSVLVAMYTFMFDYVFWATECPHFDNHGMGNLQQIPEYLMLDGVGQLNSGGKGGIDTFSGDNGLLR